MPSIKGFLLSILLTIALSFFLQGFLSKSAWGDSYYQSNRYPPGFHMSHTHDYRGKKYRTQNRYDYAPSYGQHNHSCREHDYDYRHRSHRNYYPRTRTGIGISIGHYW